MEQPELEHLARRLKGTNMRRDRGLRSYQKMLDLDIEGMAKAKVDQGKPFVWYDLCCGRFEAGIDLRRRMREDHGENVAELLRFTGLDADTFSPGEQRWFGVTIKRVDVTSYTLTEHVDLVTCLRGLRWIEKYQKKAIHTIEHWYNQLSEGSSFVFDIGAVFEDDDFDDEFPFTILDHLGPERSKLVPTVDSDYMETSDVLHLINTNGSRLSLSY